MAQKHRFNHRKQRPSPGRPTDNTASRAPVVRQRKIPTQYGKPFVVLEDISYNTFEYSSGAWIPYSLSIAQCRQGGLVKELPQKVNGKTRYEIRLPLASAD